MSPRAYWKGYLKLSLVSCPIALYPASSEREKISFFLCLLANNVERVFVAAQSKKSGVSHFALARPFGEFYFAHELRDEPSCRVLVLYFFIERLLVGAQWLHRSIERFERRVVKAGANMPRINPTLLRFVAYGQHQGAKILP